MGNNCWISKFQQSHVLFEEGGVSDHARMATMLRSAGSVNPKPFNLFTHVANHPLFIEVVNRVWNVTPPLYHSRSTLKRFHDKLKMLK